MTHPPTPTVDWQVRVFLCHSSVSPLNDLEGPNPPGESVKALSCFSVRSSSLPASCLPAGAEKTRWTASCRRPELLAGRAPPPWVRRNLLCCARGRAPSTRRVGRPGTTSTELSPRRPSSSVRRWDDSQWLSTPPLPENLFNTGPTVRLTEIFHILSFKLWEKSKLRFNCFKLSFLKRMKKKEEIQSKREWKSGLILKTAAQANMKQY